VSPGWIGVDRGPCTSLHPCGTQEHDSNTPGKLAMTEQHRTLRMHILILHGAVRTSLIVSLRMETRRRSLISVQTTEYIIISSSLFILSSHAVSSDQATPGDMRQIPAGRHYFDTNHMNSNQMKINHGFP
jgi:hypothetical protein